MLCGSSSLPSGWANTRLASPSGNPNATAEPVFCYLGAVGARSTRRATWPPGGGFDQSSAAVTRITYYSVGEGSGSPRFTSKSEGDSLKSQFVPQKFLGQNGPTLVDLMWWLI